MWLSHPVCIISNETGEGCRVEGISQRSLRSFGHWIFLVSRNLVTPLSPMSLPEQGQLVWLVVRLLVVLLSTLCALAYTHFREALTCANSPGQTQDLRRRAVLQTPPSLRACAQRDPTSAFFGWLLSSFCSHYTRLLACLPCPWPP